MCSVPLGWTDRRIGVLQVLVEAMRRHLPLSDASAEDSVRGVLCWEKSVSLAVVCELPRTLLLPLDDLLLLTREFVNARASRSVLDRLPGREGISRLGDLVT
ncbi:MAG: hypothetical protein ACFCU4_04635 [Puniceicoccaceae bacterium]